MEGGSLARLTHARTGASDLLQDPSMAQGQLAIGHFRLLPPCQKAGFQQLPTSEQEGSPVALSKPTGIWGLH